VKLNDPRSAAVVGVVAILAGGLRAQTPPPGPPPAPQTITIAPPENATFSGAIALSPDGKYLAFAATPAGGQSLLWVRSLADATVRQLPGTEDAVTPFWSPDSRAMGFFAHGKLKVVELAGSAVRVICDAPTARGGGWGPGDTIYFAPSGRDGLYRVSARGGTPVPATTLNPAREEDSHRAPQFLPDGKHFIFGIRTPKRELGGLFVGLEGSNERTQIRGVPPLSQYASEHLVYANPRAGRIMAQKFDPVTFKLVGDPFPVSDEIPFAEQTGPPAVTVSQTGVLAYRSGPGVQSSELVWFDRTGKRLGAVGPPAFYRGDIHLSPDGTRVSLGRIDPQVGLADLFTVDLATGAFTPLTTNPANDGSPIWSPDGKRIVYTSTRAGMADLHQRAADGTGEETLLYRSGTTKMPSSWDARSNLLVFHTTGVKTSWDLWVVDVTTGRAREWLRTTFDDCQGYVSPDGRWIVYIANDSGQWEVRLQTFPQPTLTPPITVGFGAEPQWRRDGKEIFFLSRDRTLMVASVELGEPVKVGTPTPLFKTRIPGMAAYEIGYVPAPDGQRVLVNTLVSEAPAIPITLVTNWNAPRR
jgi:Tol biopolymer transport system component